MHALKGPHGSQSVECGQRSRKCTETLGIFRRRHMQAPSASPQAAAVASSSSVALVAGTPARDAGAMASISAALSSPMPSKSIPRTHPSVREHRPIGAPGPMSQGLTTALIAQATDKSVEEVAYQGVPGAYSEVAARKACPEYDPLPCDQFEVAFQALSQWMSDRSVLPIENSLGGSIHAVYDLLLRYRLHIVGETSLAINHCLVALPGTRMNEIKRVMSHPQALAQCDGYLRRMGVIKEAVDDTAGAAQMVARQELHGVGALCSRRAAELYGLDVLEEGVQDVKDNITRFIVLSRDPLVTSESDTRQFKTSIVFSLKEGPGQLFKALSVFALRDIDMTKIESRPLRTNPLVVLKGDQGSIGGPGNGSSTGQRFNYLFYVDFLGTLADVRSQNALRHLQEIAPFLRVLGTYPMDTELGFTSSDDPLANGKQTPAK